MSDLHWWTIFVCLIVLLIVFSVKLCHNVIQTVYCDNQIMLQQEEEEKTELEQEEEEEDTNIWHELKDSVLDTQKPREEHDGEVNESSSGMLNESERKTYEEIEAIELECRKSAESIQYFSNNRELQYYELNEKFIRWVIALTEIQCSGSSLELKTKRSRALECVKQCQSELKRKCA